MTDHQHPDPTVSAENPQRIVRAYAAMQGMKRPERIGPYRILETLGEGGMGVVYLAEQEKPLHRRVALKVIKLGMDTKGVVARFEAEREALAVMNHPHVAKVFDAGATDDGRPFFVMEYVPGLPITEYCDRHRVSTEQRLKLFMQVCHAVQHAHQKGIIHRDIKPSNVLVSVQDDQPVPKVIDFGVAKATQARLTEKTVFTEHGQLVGTPGYMSPEQADFTTLDIDTRTDVYSLGVLLYELLVGALPFDTNYLLAAGWHELQRIIREVDPPRPSTKLSSLSENKQYRVREEADSDPSRAREEAVGADDVSAARSQSSEPQAQARGQDAQERLDQLPRRPPNRQSPIVNRQSPDPITAVAHRRRTQPGALLKMLRGDLDWVVMKCLEKDRTRRYDTATALAQDVERFLKNEPVLAGPPSVAYRLRKFIRRNRAQVALAAAILLGITATLAGTLFMYARAEESRKVAEIALKSEAQQRSVAEKALVEAQEARSEAETAHARTVEERDRALAAEKLADQRRQESETVTDYLIQVLTSVDPEKAKGREVLVKDIIETAATQISHQFKDSPDLAARLHETVSDVFHALGRYDDALSQLKIAEKQLGETELAHSRRAELLIKAGDLQQRIERVEDATQSVTSAVEILRRLGPGYYDSLARALDKQGEHLKALLWFQHPSGLSATEPEIEVVTNTFREAIDVTIMAHGDFHVDTARRLVQLAEWLSWHSPTRQMQEAEVLQKQALAIYADLAGRRSNEYRGTLQGLANILMNMPNRRHEGRELWNKMTSNSSSPVRRSLSKTESQFQFIRSEYLPFHFTSWVRDQLGHDLPKYNYLPLDTAAGMEACALHGKCDSDQVLRETKWQEGLAEIRRTLADDPERVAVIHLGLLEKFTECPAHQPWRWAMGV